MKVKDLIHMLSGENQDSEITIADKNISFESDPLDLFRNYRDPEQEDSTYDIILRINK
jgi:hypothetical protein